MDGLEIIGGDYAGYECSECSSTNTIFEEYGSSESDYSEIGIICNDCEHQVTPSEFNERPKQTEPDDVLPDSRVTNKQVGDANNGK